MLPAPAASQTSSASSNSDNNPLASPTYTWVCPRFGRVWRAVTAAADNLQTSSPLRRRPPPPPPIGGSNLPSPAASSPLDHPRSIWPICPQEAGLRVVIVNALMTSPRRSRRVGIHLSCYLLNLAMSTKPHYDSCRTCARSLVRSIVIAFPPRLFFATCQSVYA